MLLAAWIGRYEELFVIIVITSIDWEPACFETVVTFATDRVATVDVINVIRFAMGIVPK